MNRFKIWLTKKFLPVYARESLLETIDKHKDTIRKQESKILEQQAYIKGLELSIKTFRHITINNEVNK